MNKFHDKKVVHKLPNGSEAGFLWLEWKDPLGRNKDNFPEFVEESDYNYENSKIKEVALTRVVLSHAGLINVTPFNDPVNDFNWWVLHVDFIITDDMEYALNTMLGVEILDVFSNNRVRFAIGLTFDEDVVKRRIDKCLLGFLS